MCGVHDQVSKRWRLVYLAVTVGPLALAWAWCSSLLSNFYLIDSIVVGRGLPHPWTLVSMLINALAVQFMLVSAFEYPYNRVTFGVAAVALLKSYTLTTLHILEGCSAHVQHRCT
jgi:hypothetical protein